MPATSVLDLIGKTPLVELTRFDTGRAGCSSSSKAQNPGGSIKDRIGAGDDRRRRARRPPDAGRHDRRGDRRQHRPRPCAGRHRARATASSSSSPTRCRARRSCTCARSAPRCVVTRSDVGKGHPDYYQDMAQTIAERDARRLLRQPVRQPGQPGRARDDDRPEILASRWAATSTRSWSASAPAARSPASAATSRRSRRRPRWCWPIRSARCWRRSSRPASMGEAGSWTVEGIGEDFVPPNCDLSLVDEGLLDPRQARASGASRDLLRKEGILAGSSSGTLLAAALRYCREQTGAEARRHLRLRQRRQVSLQGVQRRLHGRGGLVRTRAAPAPARPRHQPLRRGRRRSSSSPNETAAPRLRPHARRRRLAAAGDRGRHASSASSTRATCSTRSSPPARPCAESVSTTPVGERHDLAARDRLQADAPRRRAPAAVRRGLVPIVIDGAKFLGLITRIDLINHFRGARPMIDPTEPARLSTPAASMPARSRDPTDRRGDDADLRHLDLRAGEPGRAQGLRIRAQPEPDPHGLRALHRRPRERHGRLRLRLRACRDRHGARAARCTAPTSSPPTTSTAARCRLFERVRRRSAGLADQLTSTSPISTRSRRRSGPRPKLVWVETPTNPLLQARRPRGDRRRSRKAHGHAGSSPTTPSPAPTSSARWSSASTSSCIRRPNTSTAIPTWSAASRSSAHDDELREQLAFLQNAVGAISGPFDSFLALRGLKTLALRMERHCANALDDRAMAGGAPARRGGDLSRARQPSAARARAAPDARLRRHDHGRARAATLPARSASSSARSCSRSPKASAASRA